MLEHIFGSKTRLKILNLFLKNPKSNYYIRQIARDTGSQLNAVRREVLNLLNFGIIKPIKTPSQKMEGLKGRGFSNMQESLKKYLTANLDFALYHELRSLLLKSQLLIEENFVKKIQSIANLSLIIFTGILVGRDDAKTDMLLVGNADRKKLLSCIGKFEKILKRPIRYTFMTPSEYKYRKDVTDKFLYDILENKKIVILDKMQNIESETNSK